MKNRAVVFLYLFILLCLALFVRDAPEFVSSISTISDVLLKSPYHDPVYFATAALDVAQNGWVSPENQWVFNLWPPGFVLLQALLIKLFGVAVPIVLVMQLLLVGLFLAILILMFNLLKQHVSSKWTFLIPLALFLFPVSRFFLLQSDAIIFGEAFSIAFFCLFFLYGALAVLDKRKRYAVFSGVFLALAAYFRSQFEIILLGLSLVAICFFVFHFIGLSVLKKNKKSFFTLSKTVLLILVVAHVCTLPWRAYHFVLSNDASWVFTKELTYRNSVLSTDELSQKGGGFVVAGRGHLTCVLKPDSCGDLDNAKQHFVEVITSQPFKWAWLKLEVLDRYWFSPLSNMGSIKAHSTVSDLISNGLLIFLFLLNCVLLCTKTLRGHVLCHFLLWVWTSLIVTYSVIFMVQQFEVRYFHFPKIMTIFVFILTVCLYVQTKKKSSLEALNGY